MRKPFSLLMSTYYRDCPEHLSAALESICQCTVQPGELILVLDGPITEELRRAILAYKTRLPIKIAPLEKNLGLGPALAHGLLHCTHDTVARFDTDDLCMPGRFKMQLAFLDEHPELDACSSPVIEFENSPDEPSAYLKLVPIGEEAVKRYARKRNPLNHPAAMFKKHKAIKAGGYQDDRYFEDYALWVRMLIHGARLDNLPEPTVWVRAGSQMQSRRGGWAYARQELKIQRKFWSYGFISTAEFLRNLSIRIPLRLAPSSLRGWVYATRLRHVKK